MLRSHGLGRLMNPRRIPLTLGTAVGAAFAAALIGLANAPAATADTGVGGVIGVDQPDPLPDPFQELFGDSGINTWTPSADGLLNSSDPTLAANFDTSVDNYLTDIFLSQNQIDPLTNLAYEFDQTGFMLDGFYDPPSAGGLPTDPISDLAVGLDYTLFASGVPGAGGGVADLVQIPYDIVIGLLYLPLLPFILAGA
jgi:hypothetical protein